jgi:PQQ-dependent dehydrogenase (methanol/ethanol family)
MRARSWCLALLVLLTGCGADEGTSPAGATNMADGMEMLMPPLPTHWIASEPVGTAEGPVTAEMLRRPFEDRQRWLLYGGNYRNWRHSPLESLNPESVKDLRLAWAFPTGTTGQFEVSPVVYAGVMYVTASYNRLFALDARSGEVLWRYDRELPGDLRACCGPVNRGVAIAGDLVLMATLDAHLIGFDRRTGEIRWDTEIAPYAEGFAATSAPLVVDDLAIIGIGGGEYGVRGFFDAYDVSSGARVWRHFTVPAAGEPGVETWAGTSYETGGAPTWTQGAYDEATDTILWTTGNPSPDFNGDQRAGDNLYSNSILAVDRRTGKRKWHFQFTPHDIWDFDGNTQLFLVDVERDGETRKLIAQANRNGYYYLLDREDGRFLGATPYVEEINWATIDAQGRPVDCRRRADAACLPRQHGRDERRVDRCVQSRPGFGLHPLDGVVPGARQGHRRLHPGARVPRRHARHGRCGRGQGARPCLGDRCSHGGDSLALHGSRADDGGSAEHRGRRRLHGHAARGGARPRCA